MYRKTRLFYRKKNIYPFYNETSLYNVLPVPNTKKYPNKTRDSMYIGRPVPNTGNYPSRISVPSQIIKVSPIYNQGYNPNLKRKIG